jgi:hypothetical protein
MWLKYPCGQKTRTTTLAYNLRMKKASYCPKLDRHRTPGIFTNSRIGYATNVVKHMALARFVLTRFIRKFEGVSRQYVDLRSKRVLLRRGLRSGSEPRPLYRPLDPQSSDMWLLLEEYSDSFQQVYDEHLQLPFSTPYSHRFQTNHIISTATWVSP